MWFLFGEVSSSSGCLGWATLFYCGTPLAFHIIILHFDMSLLLLTDTLWGEYLITLLIVSFFIYNCSEHNAVNNK